MSPLNRSQPLFTHGFLFLRSRWMTGQWCNNLCGCHHWGKKHTQAKELVALVQDDRKETPRICNPKESWYSDSGAHDSE